MGLGHRLPKARNKKNVPWPKKKKLIKQFGPITERKGVQRRPSVCCSPSIHASWLYSSPWISKCSRNTATTCRRSKNRESLDVPHFLMGEGRLEGCRAHFTGPFVSSSQCYKRKRANLIHNPARQHYTTPRSICAVIFASTENYGSHFRARENHVPSICLLHSL